MYYLYPGVAHRDLKPEQILFTSRLDLRVSDFNFGAKVADLLEKPPATIAGMYPPPNNLVTTQPYDNNP